jgi:hypothetical protein
MDHHSIEGIPCKVDSTAHTAMSTEAELHRQNERLELFLNLTSKITSSLEVREVLRAIAANIREVIHADAVVVSLPDAASGKPRVIAVDFPHGKGAVKERVVWRGSSISAASVMNSGKRSSRRSPIRGDVQRKQLPVGSMPIFSRHSSQPSERVVFLRP